MQRSIQLMFIVSLLGSCWLAMQAIHELGHVLGALATGGVIERVVLHPATISRTDVFPNPNPMTVVWAGPIIGCVMPVVFWLATPQKFVTWRLVAKFFAGFCLLANGFYIGIGAVQSIGDCRDMLEAGTPVWVLPVFGVVASISGIWLWHQMGSIKLFLSDSSNVERETATSIAFVFSAIVVAEIIYTANS